MIQHDTLIENENTRETADNIVEVREATVAFDMERGISTVLDHVNIDIRRGEILGIVGESGSGKSMLASSMLDAVDDPGTTTGKITYYTTDGETLDILNLSKEELKQTVRWEEISMVFQGAMSSFNPTMTIRGHFEETLDAHNVNETDGMEQAYELLSELHLEEDRVLDSYPHELSGGMKQRALIALSLVLEPELLILDEPTASLDLLMQRSIIRLLDKLRVEYDLTLVFITHDLPLVTECSDRIAVMYGFEFVERGATTDILSEAAHPYTRALLAATPNLNTSYEEMRPIEGSSPDPVNVPSGCSYHPRCPLADETCQIEDPPYYEIGDDHHTACFHWEDAADAVPLAIDEYQEDTQQ